MGKYVDELEARAAGKPAVQVAEAASAEPPAPLEGATALRRVADQAYRNYLRAQEEGDVGAATLQFRIYQRARELEQEATR